MLTTLQASTLDHFGATSDTSANALRRGGKLFDRAYGRGQRARMLARLGGGEPERLANLPRHAANANRTTRTVLVSLDQIVGSEGRSTDFDADFNPLNVESRERWLRVAAAYRLGIPLPPVELVQVGEIYYVRDGHHRVSVAKAMGQVEIEARIVN